MRFYRSFGLFQYLFQKCIWRFNSQDRSVYLTFDDGPNPEITPFVLEELAKFNAKASFFMVGENAKKNPELFMDVVNSGHSIGNHTFHHLNAWKHDADIWWKDMLEAHQLINSNWVRPPYGKITFKLQRKLVENGFRILMWSFISYDWDKNLNVEKAFNRIKKLKGGGHILVFHDQNKSAKNLRKLLPMVLEYYQGLGYEFKAI